MELTWYAAGDRQPEHGHVSQNLFLVLRGGHDTYTQHGSYSYGCFDVAYHPAGVGHVTIPQAQSMLGINFDFRVDLLPQPGLKPFVPHNSPMLVIAILEYWTASSQGRQIGLGRIAREAARPPADEVSRDLLELVEQDKPITEIADRACMHPVALHRAFRRRHGHSIGQYRRASQLVDALRRVSQLGESLASAAINAGFYDQSHFNRVVRQEIGVSPGDLRRLITAKCLK